LLSSRELADVLGISHRHVNRLADAGVLPVAALFSNNCARCFDIEQVRAALASLPEPTPEGDPQ
jgi:hypothetical protein